MELLLRRQQGGVFSKPLCIIAYACGHDKILASGVAARYAMQAWCASVADYDRLPVNPV